MRVHSVLCIESDPKKIVFENALDYRLHVVDLTTILGFKCIALESALR